MFNTFNLEKKLFEGQFHERDQFSLKYEGNYYKGIYHNGDITWFHPHPLNGVKKEDLTDMEEEIYKKMQDSVSA